MPPRPATPRRPLRLATAFLTAVWICFPVVRAGDDTPPKRIDEFTPRVESTRPDPLPADWNEPPVFPDGFETKYANDPHVAVHRAKGEVLVAVAVSDGMSAPESLLEFLLVCGQKNRDGFVMYERAYEAAFTTRARPQALMIAGLLAGFTPGPPPTPIPAEGVMDNSGRVEGEEVPPDDAVPAVGERVVLTVEWTRPDGVLRSAPVEDFLWDQGKKARPERIPWVFNGSYLVRSPERGVVLAADFTHVAAATYFDRSALFNLPYYSANVYQQGKDPEGLVFRAASLPEDFRQHEIVTEGIDRRRIELPVLRRAFLRIRKATPDEIRPAAPRADAAP